MATKYELTDEHRARLPEWRDRWVANALSTKAMDDDDRAAMRAAIDGLYDAAGLARPKHIVFVPSPFVLRFAGGFAAAIWWLSRNGGKISTADATDAATRAAADATYAATDAATSDATRAATAGATAVETWVATDAATWAATAVETWDATADATSNATDAATRNATAVETWDATSDATWVATRDATRDATDAATWAATWDATEAATWDAIEDATSEAAGAATDSLDQNWFVFPALLMRDVACAIAGPQAPFLLKCANNSYSMWAGGNQWSGGVDFISFFRHVARLPLDYSKWRHYEAAAIHGGPRIMHPDFCMVSDRPELLRVDAEHRPHADNGPFCRWRDGSALYAIHGVRVPAYVVETPHKITVDKIDAETNAEVRRVMIERYPGGPATYLLDAGAEVVDRADPDHAVMGVRGGRLLRRALDGDEPLVMVECINASPEPDGRFKTYWLRVDPACRPLRADGTRGRPQKLTALNAIASTFGLRGEDYRPMVET